MAVNCGYKILGQISDITESPHRTGRNFCRRVFSELFANFVDSSVPEDAELTLFGDSLNIWLANHESIAKNSKVFSLPCREMIRKSSYQAFSWSFWVKNLHTPGWKTEQNFEELQTETSKSELNLLNLKRILKSDILDWAKYLFACTRIKQFF